MFSVPAGSCVPNPTIDSVNGQYSAQYAAQNIFIDECEIHGCCGGGNYFLGANGVADQRIVIDYGCAYYIDSFIIKNTHNAQFNDRLPILNIT